VIRVARGMNVVRVERVSIGGKNIRRMGMRKINPAPECMTCPHGQHQFGQDFVTGESVEEFYCLLDRCDRPPHPPKPKREEDGDE